MLAVFWPFGFLRQKLTGKFNVHVGVHEAVKLLSQIQHESLTYTELKC